MARDGRVAIVTAASRGIGAAIARELAGQGYRLALFATSDAVGRLAEELDGIAVQGSLDEPRDLERLVRTAHEQFGRIDALVNNSGHPPSGALMEIGDEGWHQGLDMLLLNTVRLARLVTPIMAAAGGGAVVNVSAFGAAQPDAAFPLSSVLRAGVGAFTKLYADQHAAQGIRMNAVLPGFMDNYEEAAEIVARIPAGRYGRLGELAATVAFLLSDAAGYITGQSIRVDGGIVAGI